MKNVFQTTFCVLCVLIFISLNQTFAQAEWRSNSNTTVNDENTDVKRLGEVGIGVNADDNRKLNILVPSNSTNSYGLFSEALKPAGTGTRTRAIMGKITSGKGYAIGLEGYSYNSSASSSGRSYGLYSTAGNASHGYNYGVFSRLLGSRNGAAVVGYDGIDFGGWNEKVNGKFAGYFRGKVYVSNKLGIGTESPVGLVDLRSEGNAHLTIGSSLGYFELAYANCNTCFSPSASAGDIVFRTLGQGNKMIFETASTFGTGESFLFSSSGQNLMQIFDDGKVGIRTANPQSELDVNGEITTDDLTVNGDMSVNSLSVGTTATSGTFNTKSFMDIYPDNPSGWGTQMRFMSPTGAPRHIITDDYTNNALLIDAGFAGNAGDNIILMGKVRVGTHIAAGPHTNYALAVGGKIVGQEVIVTLDNWADYVFEDDYELKSLEEVEDFIESNKHLPDVPSAQEVEENGVSLGEMDAILLRKIEELTLYMIDLKKENEALKAIINQEKE